MTDLVIMLVPLVVGTLTFAAVQGLKRVSALVEAQSPAAKRILALVIAFSITWLAERLGTPSPCTVAAAEGCLESLTPTAIQGLVGALVAMAVHSLKKPAVA